MRRFENWSDELRYRVERIGNDGQGEDEKYAGGVYDMALDIVAAMESEVGRLWDDDEAEAMVEVIYNTIKYGDNIK